MIDRYLADLAACLHVPRHRRRRILDEVRDHLDDSAVSLLSEGLTAAEAEERAIASFGPADVVAAQFNRQEAAAFTRVAPVLMVACGLTVLGGFALATLLQPTGNGPAPAPLLRQIAFFIGVLGAQFAVVAGVRAVSRVAAGWRTPPCGNDVRLVRRAGAVFVGGLLATVLGWSVALLHVEHVRHDVRLVPLTAGLVAMIAGAVAAAAFVLRRISTAAAPADERPLAPGWLAVGERVIAWCGRRPWLTCGLVTLASSAAAMRHAETTLIGALPWGLAEAVAVVAGYVALGPALELRT
jgi:hypothetical protein